METHYQLNDREFERSFENGSYSHPFTHEAHLRLAWIHVVKYGELKAIEHIVAQLHNYVQKVGAEDKYHHTVTVAAIKAVHHFIRRSKEQTFEGFIAEFPRLKTQFRQLLNSHYSLDVFNSSLARKTYLEPDLAPF